MHLYFDYIPSGKINIQMDLTDTSNDVSINTGSRGLIPGMLEDLSRLQPAKLLSVLGEPLEPDCQEVTLDTINENNQLGAETHYLSINDIRLIDPCSFNTNVNPVSNDKCRHSHKHVEPIVDPLKEPTSAQDEPGVISRPSFFNSSESFYTANTRSSSGYSYKYFFGMLGISILFIFILIVFIRNVRPCKCN